MTSMTAGRFLVGVTVTQETSSRNATAILSSLAIFRGIALPHHAGSTSQVFPLLCDATCSAKLFQGTVLTA